MLGNQGKRALERGIARDPDFTGRDAEAAGVVMRANLNPSTKEFVAVEVIVVPPFDRPEQVPGCPIPNMLKVRHITRTPKGELLAREIACFACLEKRDELCDACALLSVSWPPPPTTRRGKAVPEVEVEPEQAEEEQDRQLDSEDEYVADPYQFLSERDLAEAMDDQAVEETVSEEAEYGEVYWARERRGSYWPCQAVPLAMVPEEEVRRFGQVDRDQVVWVKLFGRGQYKPLTPWQLTPLLGTTPFDHEAMGTDPEQLAAFNLAMDAKRGF